MQYSFLRKWWWLIPFVLLDLGLFMWMRGKGTESEGTGGRMGCFCRGRQAGQRAREPETPPMRITCPTDGQALGNTNDPSIFMPTVSGRLESALYGSARTRSRGGRLAAAFHEGVDIAPLRRDRRGRALDGVRSIAAGTVAYANRVAGNSSYGRYVVVRHNDPVGPVYSLYAHLSAIENDVKRGRPVGRGEQIGIIGNSSTLGIPVARSHLHLEVVLMLNRHFTGWCRRGKIPGLHGLYHGWNLTGIDPLALYRSAGEDDRFSMRDYLAQLRAAFEVVLKDGGDIDYFRIYPLLWHGDGPPGGAAVLSVSHGGVIIRGRPATVTERRDLAERDAAVLSVDTSALGRNGRGLIARKGPAWVLTSKGLQWVDILTY